ncbi:MAG: hypothetical protein KAS75_08385 [Planctomycetes bacterium]|nr:hypothetical protein [Planctomycetota bacterium]
MVIRKRHTANSGVALIVVLFIVVTITILSLGFLSRSDMELSCGKNMILRTQMDYLAESALEHARGLILHPQEVSSEYWSGAERQQLYSGNDYYDVNIVKLSECNYQISGRAYRESGGTEVGSSSFEAELRLDPCIAFRTSRQWISEPQSTINGDVYCMSNLGGDGDINGDAFARGSIAATNVEGGSSASVSEDPVDWPGLETSYFNPSYYIGSDVFSALVSDVNVHPVGSFNPSVANPAGIRYYSDSLELSGSVNISGMLIVKGDLTISGANNVITAVKNFPALLVTGEVLMETGGTLEINGFAQLGKGIQFAGGVENARVNVVGSVFIGNGDINGLDSTPVSALNSVTVTVSADKAAIEVWPTSGNAVRWSPAGGAFFRSITR